MKRLTTDWASRLNTVWMSCLHVGGATGRSNHPPTLNKLFRDDLKKLFSEPKIVKILLVQFFQTVANLVLICSAKIHRKLTSE